MSALSGLAVRSMARAMHHERGMPPRSIVILGFVVAASGCVTQRTHDALRGELNRSREALAATQDESKELREALADEQALVTDLESQIELLGNEESELRSTLASVIRDHSELEASVEEMEAALADLRARKRSADARIAEYRNLLTRFRRMIDAGTLSVVIDDGRIVLQMQSDVLFPSGSAQLSVDGAETLVEVARLLARSGEKRFQVEGHTDNVPIHTARYPSNWELSQARALRVVRTLTDASMPPQQISTAAFGEFRPRMSNANEQGRALNRRIEIVLLPDLSALPGASELDRLSARPDT